MKSSTLLDSAVFHLTPTRTRCDLIIMAHGKQEKIASGLLNPFVAHLRTAQEQIAKGGYSIVLESQSNQDTSWFTKGTLERFVRFVSTPEILERVYSIESEILQIEEAIVVQGRNDLDYTAVNDSPGKPLGSQHGSKLLPDQANEEKAIILYKPGVQQAEPDQKVPPEGNSRIQLLKVQETRKNVLQKEQGMAFARAVAAGFDFGHMAPLLSFAECFGAERLMNACKSFMDLWKKKHENGQWLEIDTPEPVLNQSEYLAMSASGIMLSSVANKHQSSNDVSSDNNEGERALKDSQSNYGQPEQFQGQFPHPMYAPWPMHSPGSVPVFPAYPVQGMPYYPTYPGNSPYYHPSYPSNGDSRHDGGHKTGKRRQSEDDKESDFESETSEVGSDSRTQEAPDFIKGSRKKAGRSGKKKSGVVVIRNINYITSEAKAEASTESGSGSGSESETSCNEDHTKTYKTSKKGRHAGSVNESFMHNKEDTLNGKDSDGGHWQAFQGFLLRGADEENLNDKNGLFAQEHDTKMKRRQSLVNDDSLLIGGQGVDGTKNWSYNEIHEISGKMSRRNTSSNDDFLLSGGSNDGGRGFSSSVNMQSTETNGKRVINRTVNDDFVVSGRRSQSDRGNLADPLADGFDNRTPELGRERKKEMGDESFIIPFRSLSLDEVRQYGRTIDMDDELPSSHGKNDDISNGIRRETNYEPDALSLMPERGMEGFPSEYDPAQDYDMQVVNEDKRRKDETNVKELSNVSVKERKSKGLPGTVEKKRTGGPMKKEKPSRMNLLEDARARAEKLRSFKADIQKIKKEKEEEDKKRIEALKLERQKRIAARANPASTATPESKMQNRKLPSKLSPISHGGSKFSDTEPGASSPLQRSKIRIASLVSTDPRKPSKAGKMRNNNHMEGNRLTRSVSSLSDSRKESFGVAPDAKASMARIRRLSEPKASPKPVTATKVRSAESVMKRKLSNGPDNKKISAIMNLDKTKAATLPELKIKASKGLSTVNPVDSTTKVSQKSSGAKSSSRYLDSGPCINNDKMSHDDDIDDNPIIEKAVVVMEYEKPSVSLLHQGGEQKSMQTQSGDNHSTTVKSNARAPPSLVDIADSTPAPSHVPESKINQASAANITADEPYLAPYARNSSLEEPITRNSEYGKAPPVSSYMGSKVKETDKPYVADVKTVRIDVIPEAMDKTQAKESAKGFRRLLKFGKKTSGTGDRSVDLENSSVKSFELDDKKTIVGSSSEVYTLKNLISQDESPSGSSSQKSSRHFSLFAPFRGKSSEKKLTA